MMRLIKNYNQKGFTLIELLVVIGIIGVLSSLLLVNYVGVRERSRDAQRKANLRQIQSALELFRADAGIYPASLGNCSGGLGDAWNTSNPCGRIYMKKIPSDPSGSSYYNSGNYYYVRSGTGYSLVACIENENDQEITNTPPTGAPTTGCGTTPNRRFFVLTDL